MSWRRQAFDAQLLLEPLHTTYIEQIRDEGRLIEIADDVRARPWTAFHQRRREDHGVLVASFGVVGQIEDAITRQGAGDLDKLILAGETWKVE